MSAVKTIIENKLKERSTENLKSDIKAAQQMTDDHSSLIFVFGLNILEDRITTEEYEAFEESL